VLTHALGLAGDRDLAFPLVLVGNRIGVVAGRLLFGDGISLIQGREAGMTVDEPAGNEEQPRPARREAQR
jgi:hypothetical protein